MNNEQNINHKMGALLKVIRVSLLDKLNQTEFGKILGVTFQQVQKYERGETKFSLEQIVILCKKYPELSKVFINFMANELGVQKFHDVTDFGEQVKISVEAYKELIDTKVKYLSAIDKLKSILGNV